MKAQSFAGSFPEKHFKAVVDGKEVAGIFSSKGGLSFCGSRPWGRVGAPNKSPRFFSPINVYIYIYIYSTYIYIYIYICVHTYLYMAVS